MKSRNVRLDHRWGDPQFIARLQQLFGEHEDSRDVAFIAAGTGAVQRPSRDKLREGVSVLDFGADPTGVSLCNSAFTAAKARCKTLLLPDQPDGTPGIYRLEGWAAQDVRLIGVRNTGGNVGANEQTVIEGSGDLLVGANNFSLEHLVIRNSTAGTRGKLITVAAIDTKIGPFIDVDFRKATYHVYQDDTTKTIVDGIYRDCHFSDANTYSRYYLGGLFRYVEENCYTASNKRGLLISSTSAAEIGGVFEVQDEGAVYVVNTVTATDTIRGLKFKNIHFELNGNVTPTADITVNVTLSLARIEFDSCGFYLPSVAKPVELSSSPTLRVIHHNCTDIDFNNVASGTVISALSAKQSGETNGVRVTNGAIRASGGPLVADQGFVAFNGISVTITGSATPTIAMPAAGDARLVLVSDSTTAGAALLLLNNGVVTVVNSTLVSIAWSVVAGILNGNTTGGASSRVLFFNYIAT
jgi:hypothetical protein